MKRIIALLLASLFILAGCQAPESIDTPKSDIYDLEIGKFSGEKYSTHYHVPVSASFPKDEYDPLDNQYYSQNYPLKYANTPDPIYQFTYRGNSYTGKTLSISAILDVTAPYQRFNVNNTVGEKEDIFYGVELWLHSGKVKALYYDEIHKKSAAISQDEIKQIVDAKASQYIDISKYETEFDFGTGTAEYHQKFGELYLSDPFTVTFADDGYIYKVDFNKTGIYDELEYELEEVEKSITEKFEYVNFREYNSRCEIKNIEHKNIDICKYDIAVVVSEVTIHDTSDGSQYILTFFTKISD